ncbi:putative leucine-rich repeat-containing protein [Monocercomonoides exilis]|uniref:putative leucine-rich repeat-containing protein n=1 Tax=Monocercomonoides exilis TaxID=2049356 RepID=UPI0035597C59|nr:putative leucine-rich repeat-containing protein [Monocercomonoides exilis]|eukprot:MONOS_41.1-p1 / transcript=MONOS_41.1 / gene=MONOS_41 / organism=Monocercomonoides_exilis_PA203 / gene_product=leucine-rich repeat-containing protein / transcript_product=leucine-rich repeat-containing protein / location=Mono_scaffold00001:167843-168809(+) / protein_length=247 / sequence_SO=supercontig / SO=protein_coding / is_pseudo=false
MDNYLTLAYKDIDSINPSLLQTYGSKLVHLDLSYNKLTDKSLGPIAGFEKLESLVLDGNILTSYVSFPYLPKLHTLSVNKNKIANLSLFIEKVRTNMPSLRFLSMLSNEACPNYFFHRSPQEYQDYRYYVISRLPTLSILDTTPVSDEERLQALGLYGYHPMTYQTVSNVGAPQPSATSSATPASQALSSSPPPEYYSSAVPSGYASSASPGYASGTLVSGSGGAFMPPTSAVDKEWDKLPSRGGSR